MRFIEAVNAGMAAAERGDFVEHEEVGAKIRQILPAVNAPALDHSRTVSEVGVQEFFTGDTVQADFAEHFAERIVSCDKDGSLHCQQSLD